MCTAVFRGARICFKKSLEQINIQDFFIVIICRHNETFGILSAVK